MHIEEMVTDLAYLTVRKLGPISVATRDQSLKIALAAIALSFRSIVIV